MEAGRATPEQTVYGAGEEGPTMQVTPEVKPDYARQLAVALGSQSPTVRALGTEMLKQSMTPQKIGKGESLITRDLFGTGGYTPVATGAAELPDAVDAAVAFLGLQGKDPKNWTAQERAAVEAKALDYKRSGAINLAVNTEKSYGGEFGQGLAKNDVSLYQTATKAPQVLQTVKDTKALLDSGKVITGFGANQRLDIARLGSALNIGGKDTKEVVANTQQLFANRAQATLDSIRESGLGAGQGFSNADRDFLEKAKMGGIVYDKASLQRQLDIEERVARASANKWNDRIKSIPESATKPTGVGPVFITQPNAPTTGGAKFLGFE
jgi:hypothetical protein